MRWEGGSRTIGIAIARIAIARVSAAAVVPLTRVLFVVQAGVGREGGGDFVGLPDVHLGAAGT